MFMVECDRFLMSSNSRNIKRRLIRWPVDNAPRSSSSLDSDFCRIAVCGMGSQQVGGLCNYIIAHTQQ